MTIIYDSVTKKFTICSRNLTLSEPDNPMVKFAVKLIREQNLEEKFEQIIREIIGENSYKSEQFLICVQGEYVGPKINGNQMQLTSDDFYMFSVRIVIQQDESALDTPVSARRWQKHGLVQRLHKGYFLDYEKLEDERYNPKDEQLRRTGLHFDSELPESFLTHSIFRIKI
jgi:hypothetical protein